MAMRWKPGRILWVTLAVIGVFIVSIAVGLLPFNLFFAKDTITDWVQENAGVQLEIEGPLRLRLGPRPRLTASGIQITLPEASEVPSITAETLSVQPVISNLLRGSIDLSDIRGKGIAQNLCPEEVCPPGLIPERFELNAAARQGQPLFIEIKDDDVSGDFRLSFKGDPFMELLEDPQDYPLEFEIDALSAHLAGEGTVSSPFSTPSFSGRLEIETQDSPTLLATAGIPPSIQGALKVHTSVEASAEEVILRGLDGSMGDYRILLDASAMDFTTRPRFEIDGSLNTLDLGDFDKESEQDTGDFHLAPYLDLLDQFDGSFEFKVGEVTGLPLSIQELFLEATVENGLLLVRSADAFIAGSPVKMSGRLDSHSDCPSLESSWQLVDFQFHQFEPVIEPIEDFSAGASKIHVSHNSCGSAMEQHLETLAAQAEALELDLLIGSERIPVHLDSLVVEAAWTERGQISFDGELYTNEFAGKFEFGSLQQIDSGDAWPISLDFSEDGSRLELAGMAAIIDDSFELESSLEFSVDRFGSLDGWIGADPSNTLPFSGRTELKFDQQGVDLQDFRLQLGQSDLKGNFRWSGPHSGEPARLDITSRHLLVSELLSLFPESEETLSPEEPDNAQDSTPSLIAWPNLGRIDFELDVARVTGLQHTVSNLSAHAKIRNREIQDGRLAMRLNEIAIDGDLKVDFTEIPGSVAYRFHLDNVDIGSLLSALELTDKLQAHAESIDFNIDSIGASFRELMQNIRMDLQAESLTTKFTYGPESRTHSLDFSKLGLTVRPGSQAIWQGTGVFNGVPIVAYMESPSVAAVFDTSHPLPLRLVMGSFDEAFLLDAVLDRRVRGDYQMGFSISGGRMDVDSVDFSTLEPPLDEYNFDGQANIGTTKVSLDKLDLQIGGSRAGGMVRLSYIEPRYLLEADLSSPFLETDDLVQWVNDFRDAEEYNEQLEKADAQPNTESATSEAGLAELILAQLDQIAERFDFDITLQVEELRSSGILLGKARLMADSDLESALVQLDVDLDGADIDVDYRAQVLESGTEYGLDLKAEQLEYGGLLRLFDPESTAKGQVYVDASLRSEALGAKQIAENMRGHLDVMGFPRDVNAGFLDLWASNLVLALLPGSDDSDKQLNCLAAKFEVQDGIMNSKEILLDSTDIIVRARGNIDLVNRELDLFIAPQSKREKFLSVSAPLEVEGPFEDFDVDLAPGGVLMTIVRWYYNLIYVPWKWITGERFPDDGIATCFGVVGREVPTQPD